MNINYEKNTKTNFQLQKAAKLQNVLNDIFIKSNFSFNNQQVFVNVIYVDISKDLMNAKAVIDIFGLDENYKQKLLQKLNKDFIKQIRNNLAQKIRLKRLPEIVFYYKEDNEKESRILDLIENERSKFNLL